MPSSEKRDIVMASRSELWDRERWWAGCRRALECRVGEGLSLGELGSWVRVGVGVRDGNLASMADGVGVRE